MEAFLEALAGLPRVTPWASLASFDLKREATLFGGVSVTPNDLDALVLLEDQIKEVNQFLHRAERTPACPVIRGDEDDFL